jgi:hypothetical protein
MDTAIATRPAVVTAGCYLLAGIGALRLVLGAAGLVAIPDIVRVYTESDGSVESGQAAGHLALLFGIWSMFLGCAFVALALLTVRGIRWARIVSWIFAGVLACATGPQVITGLADLVTWYRQLTLAVSALTFLLAVVAIVLLALPPAQPYFRKVKASFPAQTDAPPIPAGAPASARARRAALTVGLLAGALVLMLAAGAGLFVVLTSDAKTAAGAKAAAEHGLDLLHDGRYNDYYRLFDAESKQSMPRATWIRLCTQINFTEFIAKNQLTVGDATLDGDEARVPTRSELPGANTNHSFVLRYESRHWHFHEAGRYYAPGTVK